MTPGRHEFCVYSHPEGTVIWDLEPPGYKYMPPGTRVLGQGASGVVSERDTRESSSQAGRTAAESFVNAAVAFIEKWKTVRPVAPLSERQSKNE